VWARELDVGVTPVGADRHRIGLLATGMVAVTVLLPVSITDTEFDLLLVA
jgi:hypothetical protein